MLFFEKNEWKNGKMALDRIHNFKTLHQNHR
jgi:hypothetical protein